MGVLKLAESACGMLGLSMASKQLNLDKECHGGRGGGDRVIDRSKVTILLCDNDSKSCKEVFALLSSCSYQGMD